MSDWTFKIPSLRLTRQQLYDGAAERLFFLDGKLEREKHRQGGKREREKERGRER